MGLLSKVKKGVKKAVKKVTKTVGKNPLGALQVVAGAATANPALMQSGGQSLLTTALTRKPKVSVPAPSTFGPAATGGALATAARISEVLQGVQTARGMIAEARAPGSLSGVRLPVSAAPGTGLETDRSGRPLVLPVEYDAVARPARMPNGTRPSGYVVVNHPSLGRVAMLKGVARSAGLWRPARKPPVSAGDWHKLQTVARVEKRVARVAKLAGYTQRTKRARPAKRKKK